MTETPLDNLSFENALAELEGVVRALENGQITLEDALAKYERGIRLIRRCHSQLQLAERKIAVLTGVGDREEPLVESFEHAATVEAAPAKPRKRAPKKEDPEPSDDSTFF